MHELLRKFRDVAFSVSLIVVFVLIINASIVHLEWKYIGLFARRAACFYRVIGFPRWCRPWHNANRAAYGKGNNEIKPEVDLGGWLPCSGFYYFVCRAVINHSRSASKKSHGGHYRQLLVDCFRFPRHRVACVDCRDTNCHRILNQKTLHNSIFNYFCSCLFCF